MIDRKAAASCGCALKTTELVDKFRMVKQLDATGIQKWKKLVIKCALRFLARHIRYAVFLELLSWPFASVFISAKRYDGTAPKER
jgi:hypothetical protein